MDLNNVPRPLSHIGCQDLLDMQPVYSGWLKYRVTLVSEGIAKMPFIGDIIRNSIHKVRSPWFQKYVIIHNGCVYIFNNDTSIKPRTAFSLYLFNMVVRAQDLNDPKNCLWPFKLVHTNNKSQYLSASSQSEMKKWMSIMSKAMREANNKPTCFRKSRSSTASEESTYSDIEEPLYDSREMRNLIRSEEIEINNDDETEADYVSYGAMAADGSIGDPSDLEDDPDIPPASARRKESALTRMPGSFSDLDRDMPKTVAPMPPLQSQVKKKKPIDRELPSIPTESMSPTTTAYKNNWDKVPTPGVPTPGAPTPAVKPRPLPKTPRTPTGGVAVMMPSVSPKKPLPPPPQDDLVMAKWDGPKEQVKTTLIQLAKEGTFVIRDSATDDEQVLVVYVNGGIKQYKLHKRDGQFYLIENCSFTTKIELLNHYKKNFLPNTNTCLTKPYKFYNS